MPKPVSPCIGTCKFRRAGPAGAHCIGCSMTKEQKKLAKTIKKPSAMAGFVALVMAQQSAMGRYAHWRLAYLKRCLKKGAKVPAPLRKAG